MIEHALSSPKGPRVRVPAILVVNSLHSDHPIVHAGPDRRHDPDHSLSSRKAQLFRSVFRTQERIVIGSLAGAGPRCGFANFADVFGC